MERASLVVWVGHGLTPWLKDPLETLAADAVHLELMETTEHLALGLREDGHDHGGHDGHEDHSAHSGETHAEHDDDGHDDHGHKDDDHDGHEHGHEDTQAEGVDDAKDSGHTEHAGGAFDPHGWLDPRIAQVWTREIADALSAQDPANAATYDANAAAALADLDALEAELAASLAPVKARPFMVLHDGYQYFETRFELNLAGSILSVAGASPGPAGLAEVQEVLKAQGVGCVLSEPQLNDGLIAVATEGLEVKTGKIDPLGADLALGPDFYPALMRALAGGIRTCLD